MSRYTILVEFRTASGARERFLELVNANAAASLRDEQGCERFDVLVPRHASDTVFLYEIYRDRAAFDAHCRSCHFHIFDEAAKPLVEEKRVTELALLERHERRKPLAQRTAAVTASGKGERVVDAERLQALAVDLFRRAGTPEDEAELVARALVLADLRGMHSHGVLKIPVYAEKIRAGGFRVGRKGRILRETKGTALIDGENGLGQVVTVHAMETAIRLARNTGVGAVGVLNSNHFGEAAFYVLEAVQQDMIAIVATNGSPNMPAWGGMTKMTGPLPFTAGVPAFEERPFILDAALGVTNRGKLIYYAEKGETIPFGWGVDKQARPTDEPGKVLDGGWILPIGGHKGFGITMFLEILSGVLTGALVGSEIRDLYNAPKDLPQGLGHFCIAIDPGAFMPIKPFKRRMDAMIGMVKSSKLAPGVDRMVIPGEPEFEKEAARRKGGIPLAENVLGDLNKLAAAFGSPLSI